MAVFLVLPGAEVLWAKGQKPPEHEKPSKIVDKLAANLELLNQWGKQLDDILNVYKAAFNILAPKLNGTYADLARDVEFQKLCAASGIVHLGGPMLGCVIPDGAKVWLRTVRTSKVEVPVSGASNRRRSR